MKVKYDDEKSAYLVKLDCCESVTFLNTDDIVEARQIFVEHMTRLFNDAICEQLKDSF